MDAQMIRRQLESGVLLFDGSTGTYAKSHSDWPEGAVETACVSAPDRVRALHRAYLDAGCMAVKTNTFAAHVGFAASDSEQQKRIIFAAVEAAKSAAGDRQAAVFGDIGPAPADCDAASAYIQMADCFLELDVSCFLFETMPTSDGIAQAAAHIRRKNPQAFIAVSFAAHPDGFTRAGESASALIAEMDACADVDAVGLNCICGAYHLRRLKPSGWAAKETAINA